MQCKNLHRTKALSFGIYLTVLTSLLNIFGLYHRKNDKNALKETCLNGNAPQTLCWTLPFPFSSLELAASQSRAQQSSRTSRSASEKFPFSVVLWFKMHTEQSTFEASL